MKVFVWLLCKCLYSIALDPYHFAYRTNRSVNDAVFLCLHSISLHIEYRSTYIRVCLWIPAPHFNTIGPTKPIPTLQEQGVSTPLCKWIFNFYQHNYAYYTLYHHFFFFIVLTDYITLHYGHLADAFIQSDLQ